MLSFSEGIFCLIYVTLHVHSEYGIFLQFYAESVDKDQSALGREDKHRARAELWALIHYKHKLQVNRFDSFLLSDHPASQTWGVCSFCVAFQLPAVKENVYGREVKHALVCSAFECIEILVH